MRYICIEDLLDYYDAGNNKDISCLDELKELIDDAEVMGNAHVICIEDINDCYEDLERRVSKLEEALRMKPLDLPDYTTDYSHCIRREVVEDILFGSREEAERVLKRMRKQLERDKILTVADYYLLAGKPRCISYYKYGWTKLDTVSIYSYCDYRGKGERIYGLRLPDPIPIENH